MSGAGYKSHQLPWVIRVRSCIARSVGDGTAADAAECQCCCALPIVLGSRPDIKHCGARLKTVSDMVFCRASAGWVLVCKVRGAEGVVNVGTVVPTERT